VGWSIDIIILWKAKIYASGCTTYNKCINVTYYLGLVCLLCLLTTSMVYSSPTCRKRDCWLRWSFWFWIQLYTTPALIIIYDESAVVVYQSFALFRWSFNIVNIAPIISLYKALVTRSRVRVKFFEYGTLWRDDAENHTFLSHPAHLHRTFLQLLPPQNPPPKL